MDPHITVVANIPDEIRLFEIYNFGYDSSSITRVKDPKRLPSHFGYDKHNRIAEALDFQDSYILISGLDKAAQMVFSRCPSPKFHQYTEEDFTKLNSDPMVAKIYCNGEFEVRRILGERLTERS